jgi:hypothetical protein
MKAGRSFFVHLLIGIVYLSIISSKTWKISGGDISYWVMSIPFLVVHLLLILVSKEKFNGLKGWVIVLVLTIVIFFAGKSVYKNRNYKEGIKFGR